MKNEKVKIKVNGFIEISRENFEIVMGYEDQHQGLVYSIHMGYCDASNLIFEPEG